VDDLMLYVHRDSVLLNGEIDDVDGQVNSGAETTRAGEKHVHLQKIQNG